MSISVKNAGGGGLKVADATISQAYSLESEISGGRFVRELHCGCSFPIQNGQQFSLKLADVIREESMSYPIASYWNGTKLTQIDENNYCLLYIEEDNIYLMARLMRITKKGEDDFDCYAPNYERDINCATVIPLDSQGEFLYIACYYGELRIRHYGCMDTPVSNTEAGFTEKSVYTTYNLRDIFSYFETPRHIAAMISEDGDKVDSYFSSSQGLIHVESILPSASSESFTHHAELAVMDTRFKGTDKIQLVEIEGKHFIINYGNAESGKFFIIDPGREEPYVFDYTGTGFDPYIQTDGVAYYMKQQGKFVTVIDHKMGTLEYFIFDYDADSDRPFLFTGQGIIENANIIKGIGPDPRNEDHYIIVDHTNFSSILVYNQINNTIIKEEQGDLACYVENVDTSDYVLDGVRSNDFSYYLIHHDANRTDHSKSGFFLTRQNIFPLVTEKDAYGNICRYGAHDKVFTAYGLTKNTVKADKAGEVYFAVGSY